MISHFKLLCSIVTGTLIALAINNFTLSMRETSNTRVLQSMTIRRANHITKLIEFDFNRMGLGLNKQENTIQSIGPHSITFLGDIDRDGNVETVSYSLSDSTAATCTDNPHDKILYRRIDSEPLQDLALGVTQFDLRFLDFPRGNETTTLQDIKTIEITLEVQSTAGYQDEYSAYVWHSRFSPPNIRRY